MYVCILRARVFFGWYVNAFVVRVLHVLWCICLPVSIVSIVCVWLLFCFSSFSLHLLELCVACFLYFSQVSHCMVYVRAVLFWQFAFLPHVPSISCCACQMACVGTCTCVCCTACSTTAPRMAPRVHILGRDMHCMPHKIQRGEIFFPFLRIPPVNDKPPRVPHLVGNPRGKYLIRVLPQISPF